MLKLELPSGELWDEEHQEFVTIRGQTLQLEHSLVSVSKWESKWCKPFLSKNEKTIEETLDYIKCMTLTQNVDPAVYTTLSTNTVKQVLDYINAPMTATTIRELRQARPSREQVTSEIIYYWMIALNIPFECQKWHLNRLLTLIRVCEIKNSPPGKMKKGEIYKAYDEINEANKKRFHTKG